MASVHKVITSKLRGQIEGIHPVLFTHYRLSVYEDGNMLIERAPYTAIYKDETGQWAGYTFEEEWILEPYRQHRWLFELIKQNPISKQHV